MIVKGEYEIGGKIYNRCLEDSDWRYSAAAVGMMRFFRHRNISFYTEGRKLFYNYEEIDISNDRVEEQYLDFVERRFKEGMHHMALRDLYEKEGHSEEDCKAINAKLTANTVMKKIFKGYKADTLSKEQLYALIEENRYAMIRDTYVNSISGYRKFINIACYRKTEIERCRLLGFYVDTGRKTKSLGFQFDKSAATVNDTIEFDYIPFAFSKGRESIFINNNRQMEELCSTNDKADDFFEGLINEKKVSWNSIFYNYYKGSRFFDQDVEIILKGTETDHYETVFVRKKAILIFDELMEGTTKGELNYFEMLLKRSIKVNDKYYLNLSEQITTTVLNGLILDGLIEQIFKLEATDRNETSYGFVIGQLIKVNLVLYRHTNRLEGGMEKNTYLNGAYASAKEVVSKLKSRNLDNKIKGYRQRLISSIVANDYDRFIEIMLQLSSYTETSFGFLHHLIHNFEANKNLAYEFIHVLEDFDNNREEKK